MKTCDIEEKKAQSNHFCLTYCFISLGSRIFFDIIKIKIANRLRSTHHIVLISICVCICIFGWKTNFIFFLLAKQEKKKDKEWFRFDNNVWDACFYFNYLVTIKNNRFPYRKWNRFLYTLVLMRILKYLHI